MDKLGSWISMEPGLVVDGGNKAMHGVNSGVRFTSKKTRHNGESRDVSGGGGVGAQLMLETIDAGIVVFGEPTGFPTSGLYGNQEPDLSKGVSSMLHNNLWGTNVRPPEPNVTATMLLCSAITSISMRPCFAVCSTLRVCARPCVWVCGCCGGWCQYVMWYPYERAGLEVAGMENIRYRYAITVFE